MRWFIIFILILTTSIVGLSGSDPAYIVGRLISNDPLDADDERVIFTGTPLSDGGTVVAGWRKDQFMGWVRPSVWKLNPDGTPDTAFNGGSGFYEFDYGGTVWGIHEHADGGLTVSGYTGWFNGAPQNTNGKITISKLTADGTPDTTFSNDGTAVFDLAGGDDDALAHHVLEDGNILVVGESRQGEKDDTFILKASSTGQLDLSFGSGSGSVIHDFSPGEDDAAISVNVDAGGRIYILGWAQSNVSESEYYYLARFRSDGTLDTSYGDGDGWVDLTALTDEDEFWPSHHLFVAEDGTAWPGLSGTQLTGGWRNQFFSLTPEGHLDKSFADNGLMTYISPQSPHVEASITAFTIAGKNLYAVETLSSEDGDGGSNNVLSFDLTTGEIDRHFGTNGTLNAAAEIQVILGRNDGMVFATGSTPSLSGNVPIIDIHAASATISAVITTDVRYEG